MHRDELSALLDTWLEPGRFRDVAENGLQVEGKSDVQKVVCGVSANRRLIEAALDVDADAIFVHHGLVWGGGIRRLSGWLGERVRLLMQENVSLFAYHLPLDAHPELGNNAGLADALGLFTDRSTFGEYKGQEIGIRGRFEGAISFADVVERVTTKVGAPVVTFGDVRRPVHSMGICSGGAPDLLYEAIDKGLDCYLTGEVTEWVKAVAEEAGVAFIAAGHHATERFGARNIAAALADRTDLEAVFVDVENPV